jgi:LacI family transcriptional regulator
MHKPTRIGVLIGTAVTWGRELIRGIAQYAHSRRDWHLLVESRWLRFPDYVPRRQRYDGVIALVITRAVARGLTQLKVPVVNVATPKFLQYPFPGVVHDMTAMGQLAARHFLERGFRSFGVYQHCEEPEQTTLAWDVFADCVRAAGCVCDNFAADRRGSGFTLRDARGPELAAWLHRLPKPVGIFAWDAEHGRQLTDTCLAGGLLVPENVAVLAADNDQLHCEIAHPPLSGIDCNLVHIGHEAARLLARLVEGEPPPAEPIPISPSRVIVRRSTDFFAFDDPLVNQAVHYLWQKVASPLSVKGVASRMGCSRRHLDHLFVRSLGRPVAAEIRRIRLDKAVELLDHTNLSIAEVAAASGFGHAKTLDRLFSRTFGQHPSLYRQAKRANPSLASQGL